MDWPKVSWRCEAGKPCAIGGAPEVTNLVVGVVDEETSPERPLDPATVEVVVLPVGGGTLPPSLRMKKKDPKGGVVFRYEGVVEGWYRVRAFRRAGPGGPIYREVTRPAQVVKIRRPVKPEDEHKAVTLMLDRPSPAEKSRALTFFQIGFFDRNAPTEPIPGLWVVLRVPGSPALRMLRADLNGQVLLVEPDITPGLVDVITIVDDGGGPQSDSLILYDEFAPKGLPTSTLHAVQMPDKRKVADKIAAAHGIRRRHEWGARRPKKVPVDQDWDYSTVVIHHSGDRGMKVPNQIQDYHMFDTSRLYDDIGYEYLVHPDGTIYEGRFLAYKSASNSSMNTGKIGICAMGDFEHQWWDPSNDVPSPEQLNSVKALVKTLKSQFPVTRLVGHHDLDPTKECPGSKLYELLDGIRFDTGLSGP